MSVHCPLPRPLYRSDPEHALFALQQLQIDENDTTGRRQVRLHTVTCLQVLLEKIGRLLVFLFVSFRPCLGNVGSVDTFMHAVDKMKLVDPMQSHKHSRYHVNLTTLDRVGSSEQQAYMQIQHSMQAPQQRGQNCRKPLNGSMVKSTMINTLVSGSYSAHSCGLSSIKTSF